MPPEGGGYPTAGDGEALADPAAFPGEGTEMPQQSPIDKPIRNPACRGQYTAARRPMARPIRRTSIPVT